jgi:hypothetical protein
LPHVRQLGEDEDVLVRATFAKYLPQLSEIGMNIMEMTQALKLAEIGSGQTDIEQSLEVRTATNALPVAIVIVELIQVCIVTAWI